MDSHSICPFVMLGIIFIFVTAVDLVGGSTKASPR